MRLRSCYEKESFEIRNLLIQEEWEILWRRVNFARSGVDPEEPISHRIACSCHIAVPARERFVLQVACNASYPESPIPLN